MIKITPVLLAGGGGTRLWPLSRRSLPKQFSMVFNENSLFQHAALRFTSSKKISFNSPLTVTNSDFRFTVSEHLQKVGIDPGPVLIEPEVRNTGPAIIAASLHAYALDPEAILLVTPSDHIVKDKDNLHGAITIALQEVQNEKIVTFGIKPTRAETGFGYLELETADQNTAVELLSFVEKPNQAKATEMYKQGNFFWNAGIFLFRAKDMINAFKQYAPDLLTYSELSLSKAKTDLGFIRLDPAAWSQCENISIDYAIMEKAENLLAVPLSCGWSDLGGWDSVWQEMTPDKNGVSLSKNAHAFECKNSLLRSESEHQEIVGLGLSDIIAVAMQDAVLVANMKNSQNVKQVVAKLKADGIAQAEIFPTDYRPWGWFERLAISDRFQVKRISVKPGAALSLQSHHHRSEHWIVVEGTARVTVNQKVELVTEGQSIYIPLGAKHRLENPGKLPMILIEVQTGSYLDEDDIIRYEDIYSRS